MLRSDKIIQFLNSTPVGCVSGRYFNFIQCYGNFFDVPETKKRKFFFDPYKKRPFRVDIHFSGISNLSARNSCTIIIPLVFDDIPWIVEKFSCMMLVCGVDCESCEKFTVSLVCDHNTYIVPSYVWLKEWYVTISFFQQFSEQLRENRNLVDRRY